MYLFETHLHTSEASACAALSGAEMARLCFERGYSGFVVTDHFFNGYTAVPSDLPWTERVDIFVSGYLNAKSEGEKLGITVLFGIEFNFCGAEFLTYGLEPDFVYNNPDMDRLCAGEYIGLVQKSGGLLSQAHPFREADYIDGIHLYPKTEAVEVINSAHKNKDFDRRAFEYAAERNKIMTAGGDSHFTNNLDGTGVLFDFEIKNNTDFVNELRAGNYKLMYRGEEIYNNF